MGLTQLQKQICRLAKGFDSTQCLAIMKSFADIDVVPDKSVISYLQERLLALGARLTVRESQDLLYSYTKYIQLVQGSVYKRGCSENEIWSSIQAIFEANLLDSSSSEGSVAAMSADLWVKKVPEMDCRTMS